jgi:hypothetical protein
MPGTDLVRLTKSEVKKHSVIYREFEELNAPFVTSIYIMKDFLRGRLGCADGNWPVDIWLAVTTEEPKGE